MRLPSASPAAFLLSLLVAASPASAQSHVLLGVDRPGDGLPKVLVGKRVGLITNHTGHNRQRTPTIDLLAARKDMKLVALFAPEHGIRGVATGRINFETDEKTGLPVHSLFGDTQKPTTAMLENVDALVFDIQDVGVRQYTYLSTMGLAMQAAAAKTGKRVLGITHSIHYARAANEAGDRPRERAKLISNSAEAPL